MMRFLFIVLLTLQGEAMAGMRHGTAVALNGVRLTDEQPTAIRA